MFKKIMLVCLLVLGIGIGGSGASEFYAMYDKDPECFMSLDYTLYQGPAPNLFVVKANKPMFERKYLRAGGDIWRDGSTQAVEVAPCGYQGTVTPAWLCPAPAPAPVVLAAAPELEPMTFVVHFDFDKDVLTDDAVAILKDALAYATEFGEASVYLDAFCDFRGSDDYNIDLGGRRAGAVSHWLIENGVDASRFGGIFNNGDRMSPDRIMAGRYCADCWEDRRVEISIDE